MEYYSAIETNEIMPFVATWIYLEFTILSEVSHKDKEKRIIWYHLYVESKIQYKWTYFQNALIDLENKLKIAKEEGEGYISILWLIDTNCCM